jgi:hypothetical protein
LVSCFFGEIVDKPEVKFPVPKIDVKLLVPNTNGSKEKKNKIFVIMRYNRIF